MGDGAPPPPRPRPPALGPWGLGPAVSTSWQHCQQPAASSRQPAAASGSARSEEPAGARSHEGQRCWPPFGAPWVQGGAGLGWVWSGGFRVQRSTWPRGRWWLVGSVAGGPDRHRGWHLCPSPAPPYRVPAAGGRGLGLRPRVLPAHRLPHPGGGGSQQPAPGPSEIPAGSPRAIRIAFSHFSGKRSGSERPQKERLGSLRHVSAS
jgi:hypothetical protein